MSKMLPAEIIRKQGARVLDNKKSLAELLKAHGAEQLEIGDLKEIMKEIQNTNSFGQIQYYQAQIDMK